MNVHMCLVKRKISTGATSIHRGAMFVRRAGDPTLDHKPQGSIPVEMMVFACAKLARRSGAGFGGGAGYEVGVRDKVGFRVDVGIGVGGVFEDVV